MSIQGGARARSLAAELRDLRVAAKLTLRQVASLVDISVSTLSRVENGERAISPQDTNALLTAYRVTGPNRARLLAPAGESTQSSWWETVEDELPKHMYTLKKLEADASRIVHVAMLRVPGLLQTQDYARTVMMVGGIDPCEADSLVAARMQRHAVLTKQRAPRYLAIVDEVALRRVTGSRALMAQQMDYLGQVAALPAVDLRVIPFDHGAHQGLDGSFVLMRFPKGRPVLLVEHSKASTFVDSPSTIRLFQETVDSLTKVALGSADSVKFIRRLAEDFRRE